MCISLCLVNVVRSVRRNGRCSEEARVALGPTWTNRSRTRGLVLDAIRAARTISRVELASATGLAGATVSELVRELIDDGLVVEAGPGAPTGGKPRTLMRLDPGPATASES
nr:hypothetical protein GCM10025732_31000 [Glycomyces mayteni]